MADKLQILDDFFRQGLWFKGTEQGLRIMGVSIKIEPTGYLAIVRAIGEDGPKVAFLGAKTIEQVYRNLQDLDALPLTKWREDRYALDK